MKKKPKIKGKVGVDYVVRKAIRRGLLYGNAAAGNWLGAAEIEEAVDMVKAELDQIVTFE